MAQQDTHSKHHKVFGTVAGIILIVVGLSYYFPSLKLDKFWPILLIAAGAYLIWKHYQDK